MVAGGGFAHEYLGRPITHVAHWWWEARAEPEPDALRVVVLGDSSAMGIGASRPSQTLAGRTVAYLRDCSDLPVHVTNVAAGGASTAATLAQAQAVDTGSADLVLLSVGSADVMRGQPLPEFERDAAALLAALPAQRTAFSEIAAVPGHEPYRDALAAIAAQRGIALIEFEAAFQAAGRLDVFAPDGLHLNSRDYGIWFDSARPVIDDIVEDC